MAETQAAPADTVNKLTEKTTEFASNAVSTAGDVAGKGVQAVKDFSGKVGFSVFFTVIIGIVIFFLAYVLYTYISSIISNKIAWVVPETKVPILGNIYTRASGDGIPTTLNGNRLTFMYWVYIYNINSYAGDNYRHVLHRGENDTASASPLVMLDKASNKMYIRFNDLTAKTIDTTKKTWEETLTLTKTDIYKAANPTATLPLTAAQLSTVRDEDALTYDLATHGIVVDYVPLQRWVHIAVVVNETVNRGSISLYMDGELIKVITSSETVTVNGRSVNYNFSGLDLAKKGDIYIGGGTSGIGVGFSGLTGKVAFTNYDMNAKEIYKEYLKGPVDNLTSKMGLPAYGLRSPVYRIG